MAKTYSEVKEAYNGAAQTKITMSSAITGIFVVIIIGLVLTIALRALFRFARIRTDEGMKHLLSVTSLLLLFLVLAFGFFALVS